MSRILRYLLIVGSACSGILLFLLTSASSNTNFFEKQYQWLYGLNAGVTLLLLLLVVLFLIRLYRRWRGKQFGSRLMTRFVLLFAIMGIVPGIVIYTVSVQFVSRSIESWFNVQVHSALSAGLTLGRTSLDESLHALVTKANSMAFDLSDMSDSAQTVYLVQMSSSHALEVDIISGNGRLVNTAGGQLGNLLPELPTPTMLHQAKHNQTYSAIETSPDIQENSNKVAGNLPGMRLRVIVPIPSSSKPLLSRTELRYLQLLQPVPSYLAENAEAVTAAYSEYQVRSLGRTGLRKMYVITLTLTLFLVIFTALVSAFLIADRLTRPLLVLAEGTQAVAEGDYSPRPIIASHDELGTLTKSFNSMTRQLFDARRAVDENRLELENAKAYLESVLANMFAGVMVLDKEFRIISFNQSVERILLCVLTRANGMKFSDIPELRYFAEIIIETFNRQSAQQAALGEGPLENNWQRQIEILSGNSNEPTARDITLLARGSRLPVEKGLGYVVVFDDISEVISAQRLIAWGEVAQRLAHEIKNPLTPIQLSAERLQMKLEDKLDDKEKFLLKRATTTIVNQVNAMKCMVDDFRNYAKTPKPTLATLDLNALISEVSQLYLCDDGRDVLHLELAADLPLILGDENQLRQVIHNLIKNAEEAVSERNKNGPLFKIELKTERILYAGKDGSPHCAVQLSVEDNGLGFSAELLTRAFEPYVTSKSHGTGLGLALVKKIIEEHGGRVDLQNRTNTIGAKVCILLLKLSN